MNEQPIYQIYSEDVDRRPSEIGLWAAVLHLAILDVQKGVDVNSHDEAKTADMWIRSELETPGSCRWVCKVLGIDCETVRKMLNLDGKKLPLFGKFEL